MWGFIDIAASVQTVCFIAVLIPLPGTCISVENVHCSARYVYSQYV